LSPEFGQNYDIEVNVEFFENEANFRCLGTTVTNQNLLEKLKEIEFQKLLFEFS
jgi:hypothetical protein